MRFLKRFSSVQARAAKSLATIDQPIAHLHSHPKPVKANQALKRSLEFNCTSKTLLLFRNLLRKNTYSIDSFSLLFVLKACTQESSFIEGQQMHGLLIKLGFNSIIFLQTSLINVYSVAGNLDDAHRMFDEIPFKNVVCWTALISAYVDNHRPSRALLLFRQMQMDDVEPDQVTVTVALSACADVGALDTGEWIHAYVCCKQRIGADPHLNNALINMYAKCGDIETARRLFETTLKKDVTTWTSMIVGHALNGQAEKALELFAEMEKVSRSKRKQKHNRDRGSCSISPNHVTFIGVLLACSHAGMVEAGKQHFESMIHNYGLKPRLPHFGCMVDLLCRAGLLQEAYGFILQMPVQPNAVVWRTLLGACSLHGNIKLGEEVQQQLLVLEPGHVGDGIAMSNIFASRGMWDQKAIVRDRIMHRRAPGCSSIEVGSGISEFVSADDDHPWRAEIYQVLEHLLMAMGVHGYSPATSSSTEH